MAGKTDRVALVTGASSGIGEAAARALVGAGFTVYGTSRRATPGEKRGEVVFLPLDVTDDESVASAVREVLDRSGRIGDRARRHREEARIRRPACGEFSARKAPSCGEEPRERRPAPRSPLCQQE